MSRVKRGNVARKRRKKILDLAKGFRGGLSKLYRPAHQAVLHALSNKYRDRRLRKRSFRSLWIVRINAGLIEHGISYSKFMGMLQKKSIQLNRKTLSQLAATEKDIFDDVVKQVTA